MQQPPRDVVTTCVLACLWPGAGHVYAGRRERGLLLSVAIVALFVIGVALDARLAVQHGVEDPIALILSGAQMAAGFPYLLARVTGFEAGRVTAVTYEYGNTLTAVAGLLNVLVVLDAFDVATGRKP